MVNVFTCSMFPMLLLPWCIHKIRMVDGSTRGLFIFNGIIGSSYVIVYVDMCTITCMSRKGPMFGVILAPFVVRNGEYGNGVGVFFCC